MKPSLAAVIALCTAAAVPSIAHAGDSTWLLCKGIGMQGAKPHVTKTYFAASLLEHRGSDGSSRDLGVTLMYGDHVNRGVIQGKTSGDFQAKAVPFKAASTAGKSPTTFTGTAQLGKDMKSFTLTGNIDWTFGDDPKAERIPFTAKLTCETLDDLSIK